jgi:hypothetical protein
LEVFTANKANDLLQRRSEFWQREYLDRYVRNAKHYATVLAYIEDNPVKAGLVKKKKRLAPEQRSYSSWERRHPCRPLTRQDEDDGGPARMPALPA